MTPGLAAPVQAEAPVGEPLAVVVLVVAPEWAQKPSWLQANRIPESLRWCCYPPLYLNVCFNYDVLTGLLAGPK